jgi:hypothetical protein
VHDGLVVSPGREREVQLWMMRALNQLPWVKVDVDTRWADVYEVCCLKQMFGCVLQGLRYVIAGQVTLILEQPPVVRRRQHHVRCRSYGLVHPEAVCTKQHTCTNLFCSGQHY